MIQAKWLKLGAAGFLSIGMLAACGNDEPTEEDNGDTEMQNEEDSNMDDSESEDNEDENDSEEED